MKKSANKSDRIMEGTRLWEPSDKRKAQANVTRYLEWLKEDAPI